jgi:hypothetical protein
VRRWKIGAPFFSIRRLLKHTGFVDKLAGGGMERQLLWQAEENDPMNA